MTSSGRLCVFGASSATGRALLVQAREGGWQVGGAARQVEAIQLPDDPAISLAQCNAMDPEQVEAAFAAWAPVARVVSLIGGKPGDTEFPDAVGNKNIVDAALAANVEHMTLVTSIGAGDSRPAMPPAAAELLGPIADLKTEAEDYLRASGLPFTILRPGHLQDGESSGDGVVSANPLLLGAIRRGELARVILACAAERRFEGQTLSVADRQFIMGDPGEDVIVV